MARPRHQRRHVRGPSRPDLSITRGRRATTGTTRQQLPGQRLRRRLPIDRCGTIRLATEGALENFGCYVTGANQNPTSGNTGTQNANLPDWGFETTWYTPGGTVTVRDGHNGTPDRARQSTGSHE